jgi:predicted HTH transcriptional regulator
MVNGVNEESANQFKTIIWRTIQKNENTIQKSLTTIQKEVLEFLKNNPNSTLVEVIDSVPNLSEGGLKFIIMKLKKLGLLKREGGRKSGVWVVVDNK